MKINNPWYNKQNQTSKQEYIVGKPVYTYKDYNIYGIAGGYLYTCKNNAFNHLVGLNKEHLVNVADRNEPREFNFLYNRAIENLNKVK